jgi:adenosyl cobinamide kinase/adenosyl cobinamide phosphate guanylyltransferase
MALLVLLGGARSGKSRLAVDLAGATGAPVTFVATGEAGDAEMADRIAAHRAQRPAGWETVEEPYRLADTLTRIDGPRVVVVDCLECWRATGPIPPIP